MTTEQLLILREQIIADMNAKRLDDLLDPDEYNEILSATFTDAWMELAAS